MIVELECSLVGHEGPIAYTPGTLIQRIAGHRSPRDPYNRPSVAYRSPDQLLRRRRIEALIRLAAPALDLVLYTGDRVTRAIGRNELPPDVVKRTGLPPARRD